MQALVRLGATRQEIHETLGVATYMGGGPSLMYAASAIAALEQFLDESGDLRIHHAGEGALEQAEGGEDGGAGGQAAAEREEHESDQPGEEHAAPAESVAKSTGGDQHEGEGE